MPSERALVSFAVGSASLVLILGGAYFYQFHRVRSFDLAERGPLTEVRYLAAPAREAETTVREEIYWPTSPESARRFVASYDELRNSFMLDAILASEDKRFEDHEGIDFYALLPRLVRGHGASTIDMQLARTAILHSRLPTVFRKVNESFAAMALEALLNKGEIVTAYANSIYCGTSRSHLSLIGVKSAAYYTFGKELKDLTVGESASIAGLFARPKQLLDAYAGDSGTMQRYRDRVLRRMREQWPDRYSEESIRLAEAQPVTIATEPPDTRDTRITYGYYLDAARTFQPGLARLPQGSDVVLAVDPDAQRAAGEALAETVAQWQVKAGPDRHLDGAIVAIEPASGDIIALIGGIDYRRSPLNRALQSYEPGSIVKPPIYADALARLSYFGEPFTAATRINLADGFIADWSPADHATGSPVLRDALAMSSNRAAVSVGKGLGLGHIGELLSGLFKIHPRIEGSLLLGGVKGAEAEPLAVAEAYAAFVNGGRRPRARLVREIRHTDSPVQKFPAQSAYALDPAAAGIVLQTSRSVTGDIPVSGATLGSGKKEAGLPDSAQVGGKTGTGKSSNWAVLVHPHLVVAVLIACDAGCELQMDEGFTGGNVAGAAWASFVRKLYPLRPKYFEGSFEIPSSLVQIPIDPTRGCAHPATGGRMEYFIPDRQPRPCISM